MSHNLSQLCDQMPTEMTAQTLIPMLQAQVAELFDGLEDPIIAVSVEVENSEDERQELIDLSLTYSARLAVRSVTGLANHEDCLEEFNKYVQGPMHDAVVEDLGDVTDIPYGVCLLAMFPWILSFFPVTWAGRPALHALGYRSDFEYLAVEFTECLFFMLVYPAAYPCLLRCVRRLDNSLDSGFLQAPAAFGCGLLIFNVVQLENAFASASLETFAFTRHPAFLCFFLLAVVAAMFQHYVLFGAGSRPKSNREMRM
ncbi:unnamed protein product [Symbiodinium sp. CCMP2456]|nr:unnamed protein product [Symbiodinium sp. CCMP2456]